MNRRSMAALLCSRQADRCPHEHVRLAELAHAWAYECLCCVLLCLLFGVVSRREISLALLRQYLDRQNQMPAAACRGAWEPSSPWPRRELP